MRFIRLLSTIILITLAGQGCSTAVKLNRPNNVLFYDHFSDNSKKWDQISNSSASTAYYDASFRIIVNTTSFNAWANPGNESFVDTRIEVDATKNSGPDDNEFGVICRYLDASRFYFAAISSDGYYAIMKMTNSGAVPIGESSMLESDTISHGAVTNHIRFDCVGSTLTLFVNGSQVDQQADSDYITGNIGLLAGTFGTPGTDVIFDNFFVYKPVADVQQ
jgi:hypothetical protein